MAMHSRNVFNRTQIQLKSNYKTKIKQSSGYNVCMLLPYEQTATDNIDLNISSFSIWKETFSRTDTTILKLVSIRPKASTKN